MFDLEWTGRNHDRDGSAADRARAAADETAAQFGYNPAVEYAESCGEDGHTHPWEVMEAAALSAAFYDWHSTPDNVSLVWRG